MASAQGTTGAARRAVGAGLAALLATAVVGAAAASGGHGHEAPEPVPTGAELAERCAEYRDDLEFTRAQLKARNLLGRWDFLKAEHRKRERFVNAHCEGDGQDASGETEHGR